MANRGMLTHNRQISFLLFHPFHEFHLEALCFAYRKQFQQFRRSPEIRSTSTFQLREFFRQP